MLSLEYYISSFPLLGWPTGPGLPGTFLVLKPKNFHAGNPWVQGVVGHLPHPCPFWQWHHTKLTGQNQTWSQPSKCHKIQEGQVKEQKDIKSLDLLREEEEGEIASPISTMIYDNLSTGSPKSTPIHMSLLWNYVALPRLRNSWAWTESTSMLPTILCGPFFLRKPLYWTVRRWERWVLLYLYFLPKWTKI